MQPISGMPATFCIGSDRYPVTISRVSKTGAVVWFTRDRCVGKGLYEVVPDGEEFRANRTKTDSYRVGQAGYLRFGERAFYNDPSF